MRTDMMKTEREDIFMDYKTRLEEYKWITVDDLSELMDISKRSVFKLLEKGSIEGIKWKNRRLIDTTSVIKYLHDKGCLNLVYGVNI
ncbi:MerR family transcriptional regulator [[Muricauda] lutisoli]|uniref:DNA-binding protein n=1 Tax=[Muricauda] lutisoli TaxID=2816035 RepID=A0ABS3EU93_9FLAO|nr:hypothetical protein [[Muricauda] lutisoli]MBO0329754.1 hypothetical protein [[Muricauda] lutisoli]